MHIFIVVSSKKTKVVSIEIYFIYNFFFFFLDLKSDNIFVTLGPDKGIHRLAVGDFDTARTMKGVLAAHTIVGTPSFIAPEVLNSKKGGGYNYKADGMNNIILSHY